MPQKPSLPSFDLIAPVYDRLARVVFGAAQQQAQSHFLASVPTGATVLILGGGTGWLLTELLDTAQPSYVLYIEASDKMLRQAKARLLNAKTPTTCQVEFRRGTEADLLPEERFHVVMTPFVLDLFTPSEAREMMRKLNAHLVGGGLWLQTDFQETEDRWKGLWQKPLLWAMYRFFGWVSHLSGQRLPPLRQLFQELGLVLEAEAFCYRRFICAQQYRKPGPEKRVARYGNPV